MKLTHGMLNTIKEAYDSSTKSWNRFAEILDNLETMLGGVFTADGEVYFIFENAIFTTPSYDPFDMPWKPSVTWRDCGKTYEF